MSKVTNKQLANRAFEVHKMVLEYMGALNADGLYDGGFRAVSATMELSVVHDELGKRPADYAEAARRFRAAQMDVMQVELGTDLQGRSKHPNHARTRMLLMEHLWDLEDLAEAKERERERRRAAKETKPRALFRGSAKDGTKAIADALNGALK